MFYSIITCLGYYEIAKYYKNKEFIKFQEEKRKNLLKVSKELEKEF
jgi:hypothetical protein